MAISANVPYNPLGGITPSEGVPANDENRFRANPEQFGAQVGAATEKVGGVAEDLGTQYLRMATEAKAENTIANQFAPAAAKLKADFMSKQGIDAVKAEPQYIAGLTNLRQQFLDQSGGPYEKQILSNWMSRHSAQEVDGAATYAASQQNKYEEDSHKAMLGVLSTSMAMNYNNPNMIDDSMKTGDALILKRGIDTGKDQQNEIPALQAQFRGDALKNAIDSATFNGDIPAAKKLFDTYKSQISPKDLKDLDVSLAPKIADYDSRNLVQTYGGHITDQYNHRVYQNGLHPENDKSSDDILSVIRNSEGIGYKNDSKGEVINGINSQAYPKEFAEAKNILATQGQKAVNTYADNFYQKNILDKYDIKSLPRDTQAIVADGLVNHSTEFGKSLVEAAKNGSTPEQLIDMRRSEYQRLATADPAQYGPSLNGWLNRLDKLPKTMDGRKIASDGKAIPSMADFYKANYSQYLSGIREQAENMRPGDVKFADQTEARFKQHMDSIIEQTNRANEADKNTILKAANGDFSKGEIPMTRDQLIASDPSVKAAVTSAQTNNPAFANTIDTIIAKASSKNQTVNSPNGYDTILRTLLPNDGSEPNAIKSQGQLDALLGKNDGTGINMKDYKDAKQLMDASQTWKDFLRTNMKQITNANGNVDGQGSQRALNWYNQVNQLKQKNDAAGDKKVDEDELIENIKESSAPHMPSKMEQITNWVKSFGTNQPAQPVSVNVVSPTGQVGTIPAENLDKALAAGYKKAP